MPYEKSLENTMNRHNQIIFCFIFPILTLIFCLGCSEDPKEAVQKDSPSNDNIAQPQNELLTIKDTIYQMLNEPWERAKYSDNSGYYENEFSYVTDETSLDDYITWGQITYKEPYDILEIQVGNIAFYRPDSARVDIGVLKKDSTGKEWVDDYTIPIYYFEGRWIKPTVAIYPNQKKYEDRIRQAIEAADDEG